MWDYRHWSSERGSHGSLRYALHRSKKSHNKNNRYPLFLQRKTERGKKRLYNCKKYSKSTENMEKEKSYTRRENSFYSNNSDIQNCF